MRTQVCIIGGGPAGLFLAHVLHAAGIESIVIERQTKNHVLSRIRAGVLEAGTVDLLRQYGLAGRMDRDGMPKDGTRIFWEGKADFWIDVIRWTGKRMMVWGQTQITEDLYAARERDGGEMVFEVENVALHDLDGAPSVTFDRHGESQRIDCDFIAGCDGFHGPSRMAIPADIRREYERAYPFGWLGIMVEKPPMKEIAYAYHSEGFAMASRRNPMLSRYYVQVPSTDKVEDWSDDRFWEALHRRLPEHAHGEIETGPSIEKSIAPLRSFVTEPMRFGRLFLCGDAAHIVPPTGAKGLNSAASDVYYLFHGLKAFYADGDTDGLDGYSQEALDRVWKVERFSWWMTSLLHRFPDQSAFDQKMQEAEIAFLSESEAAQEALARNYVGLPY